MGSREKDQTARHQPLLSSLLVRPTESGGGVAGTHYEPGEVRRDPPPYLRSNRYNGHGYRMCAGSLSPVRGRDAHHRFSPGFESSGGASRSRGLGNGKETRRYCDYSPPYGRGRDGERFLGKGHDQSARGPGPGFEGLPRTNPSVRPREGDWICSDPSCKNLNFARREECHSCNKPRYASPPRRRYLMPPLTPRPRVPPPPLYHSPGRTMNGSYRSPPRGWPRDIPRDLRIVAGPLQRREVRFPDPLMRSIYPEDVHPRDRYRYDRPVLPDWGHRDHGRHTYFNERRGHRRRVVSPSPAAVSSRGWASASHIRNRSRSSGRGGEEPKNHKRDMYGNRKRDDPRGVGRDAF